MRHEMKIWPEQYDAVLTGAKRAEFRDLRDREPIVAGDTILLREYKPFRGGGISMKEAGYTGLDVTVTVTHVQMGFGIPEGFAMISVAP